MKKIVITLLSLITISLSASAQRTSPGSMFFGAFASSSLSPAYGQGITAEVGKYGLQNYIRGGIVYASYREPSLYSFGLNQIAVYERIFVEADYMYRLFGSYSRWFNLYAGGGLHIGVDEISKCLSAFANEYPDLASKVKDEKKVRLTEGVQGIIEVEMYPFRRVGFSIGTRLMVAIPNGKNEVDGTKYLTQYIFYPDIYAGVRFNL